MAVAEINAIEIGLENLTLRKSPVDAQCQQRFFHLAVERPVPRQRYQTDQLLGNGAAAGLQAAFLHIHESRARDAEEIHPGMLEEVAIFGRQHGRDHRRGDAVEGDARPVLAGEGKDQLIVAVEDERRLRGCIDLHLSRDVVQRAREALQRSKTKHQSGGKE